MRTSKPEYISREEARRRLHCAAPHIDMLAESGRIGTRKIPGIAKTRFNAADVERIRREAITPARPVETPPATKLSKRRRADAIVD
jgi:hypothetical protein